jgi:hypothetical protein
LEVGVSLLAQSERERPQISGFGTDGSREALDLIDRLVRTRCGRARIAW